LVKDTIQMAGFSVNNQVFAVCNQVSEGLLNDPVSGLLGLAWQQIASSGASPFWETLANGGAWDSPVMAFHLSRFVDDATASTLEPGGSFTMGFVNQDLYTGDIDYQNIAGTESYWLLALTAMTVQGNSITVPSGTSSYAAIDTGTTLIGGPSTEIAAIFAQIPGSAAGTGNYDGYYTYPCSTSVNVTMTFGGRSWPISAADFQLAQISSSQCLGAFFELETDSSAPSWIVGDTFLKNVLSVFRFNPPSVGFAELSSAASSASEVTGSVPTATIGSVAAAVSATGKTMASSSAGRVELIVGSVVFGLITSVIALMI